MGWTDDCLLVNHYIGELNRNLTNLQKAPNRQYKKQTLIKKLTESKDLYNKISELLVKNEADLNIAELEHHIKTKRSLYGEIDKIIKTKLPFAENLKKFKSVALSAVFCIRLKIINMAKVDLKTGTALVDTYDGSPEKLDSFLDSIRLFSDLVNSTNADASAAAKTAAQTTVTRFIRSRLSGTARQAVPENANFDQIIAALKEHCSSKITAENILAKLKNVKQTTSTESFCEEVENLSSKLKSVYISKQIPIDVATQMATKSGIDALISGSKSKDTKLILKAGTFTKLSDAVQKVQENDAQSSGELSQIFYTRGNRRFQSSRPPNNFRRGFRGARQQSRGLTRFNYQHYQPNNNRPQYRQYNQRGQGRPYQRNAVFYAQNSPFPPEQHNNVAQHPQLQQHLPQLQHQQHQQALQDCMLPMNQSNFLGTR